ncbi:MAG: class I SAM-dependent methyltransferase [Cyanobacteria bacterium P01_A01_bin.37]
MGFYSTVMFPRLLDWIMSNQEMTTYREALLRDVTGNVLEIGFGTGLNLPHYPPTIEKITTVDVNPGTDSLAQNRIQQSGISVESLILNGEQLPMQDKSFDSVVSTWTLCSIANVNQALSEIHRVLKPGGQFFFIEHGLSDNANIQVWQHRLNPIQKVIGDGCNLNRNIQALISHEFESVNLERFDMSSLPAFASHTYKGVAIKAA